MAKLKIGDKVQFKNPNDYDKGQSTSVQGSTIKDIVSIESEAQAKKMSLAVLVMYRKRKNQKNGIPFDVAKLSNKTAVLLGSLTTFKEPTTKTESKLTSIIRKMIKEELEYVDNNPPDPKPKKGDHIIVSGFTGEKLKSKVMGYNEFEDDGEMRFVADVKYPNGNYGHVMYMSDGTWGDPNGDDGYDGEIDDDFTLEDAKEAIISQENGDDLDDVAWNKVKKLYNSPGHGKAPWSRVIDSFSAGRIYRNFLGKE